MKNLNICLYYYIEILERVTIFQTMSLKRVFILHIAVFKTDYVRIPQISIFFHYFPSI